MNQKYLSRKPIIEHIEPFLFYCAQEGLKEKTIVNYSRFLNKFLLWIKDRNFDSLLPHQLTLDYINDYRLYLSKIESANQKGKNLHLITQNYYLIALRAFLGYFVAKDVLSLPPDKIALSRPVNGSKGYKYPTNKEIEALLSAPDFNSILGLRNKAILYTIAFTGTKVQRLVALNRDSCDILPQTISNVVKNYLRSRNDSEEALFINYNGRKDASRRLTPRMIERIVKKYGNKVGISNLTPENLRSANIISMWNKKVDVGNVSWKKFEGQVEINHNFLKQNISVLPDRFRSQAPLANLISCDDCVFRKIAILISAKIIRAYRARISDIWPGFYFDMSGQNFSRHGKEWHRKMIDAVGQYHKKNGAEISIEPVLDYGRADLGITNKNIYIEIGTVSVFKIWYNLMVMPECTFILVPSEDTIIKLEKHENIFTT